MSSSLTNALMQSLTQKYSSQVREVWPKSYEVLNWSQMPKA